MECPAFPFLPLTVSEVDIVYIRCDDKTEMSLMESLCYNFLINIQMVVVWLVLLLFLCNFSVIGVVYCSCDDVTIY